MPDHVRCSLAVMQNLGRLSNHMDLSGMHTAVSSSKRSTLEHHWNTGPSKSRKWMICSTVYWTLQRSLGLILKRTQSCDCYNFPNIYWIYLFRLSAAIIMLTTYGYKVLPKDDPFQEIVEEGNTALCESVNPDASLVNVLPFLRFLPSWFPGADFHHVAQVMNKKVVRMVEVPYKYVQDNLVCLWLNSHLNIFLTYFVAICGVKIRG